jgi:hypothetical protein
MKTFVMDDDQETKLKKWLKNQAKTGAGTDNIWFCFQMTPIGTGLIVRNSDTGKEIDLTDYKTW